MSRYSHDPWLRLGEQRIPYIPFRVTVPSHLEAKVARALETNQAHFPRITDVSGCTAHRVAAEQNVLFCTRMRNGSVEHAIIVHLDEAVPDLERDPDPIGRLAREGLRHINEIIGARNASALTLACMEPPEILGRIG